MKAKKMKLLEKMQKKGPHVTQCISPNKLLDKTAKVSFNSFVWQKSSEICKLFPSSPSKFVQAHLVNLYKFSNIFGIRVTGVQENVNTCHSTGIYVPRKCVV